LYSCIVVVLDVLFVLESTGACIGRARAEITLIEDRTGMRRQVDLRGNCCSGKQTMTRIDFIAVIERLVLAIVDARRFLRCSMSVMLVLHELSLRLEIGLGE
jgi:hypothetical protein